MDNFRLILIMALLFISLMIYQAWQQDYAQKPDQHPPVTSSPPASQTLELPETSPTTVQAAPELPGPQVGRLLESQARIQVETDMLKLEIDTLGGDIRQVDLLEYSTSIETMDEPFRLLDDSARNLFVLQSGILPAEAAPTHQSVYHASQTTYQMSPNADKLQVDLRWQGPTGLTVTKTYLFTRGSYIVDLHYHIDNQSSHPWQGQMYGQFQRSTSQAASSPFIYTYLGGAISKPTQRYEKIDFDEITAGQFALENPTGWAGGWAAMLQHYFVSALVPEPSQTFNYYTKFLPEGPRYVLGLYGPLETVAPHSQHRFTLKIYMGPKLQHTLAALAPGLDLTVDYGWLWFIAQPLFWLLELVNTWVSNWGLSIIIITILIKLAFFHLSATSYKSMANMRRLQPQLLNLKERYGDDRARLNQAMMDLYRREKINPLGGCLPILIQIPVFIALYWVLLESVELRQAPFMLWIQDLSTPDPYFVLPLVMGVTMLLQHHLNPAPLDPVQQKVMMILPIVFTVFFAFFPSGLVLYWVVNNILSIAQQWVITKKIAGHV